MSEPEKITEANRLRLLREMDSWGVRADPVEEVSARAWYRRRKTGEIPTKNPGTK